MLNEKVVIEVGNIIYLNAQNANMIFKVFRPFYQIRKKLSERVLFLSEILLRR